MVDDSVTQLLIEELPNGMIDAEFVADIDAIVPLYISGDRQVTAMGAAVSEANAKMFLGYNTAPVKFGEDNLVPVKSRFSRVFKAKAGDTVTAGMPLKFEFGGSAKENYFIPWIEGTDVETELAAFCWFGGIDEGDIEVLLF